ncbi:4Fe-4S dicluster domain-containing protein [Pyrococcus yayanosii]|uniref:4Fe-4S dicluster domain-containing protein n=1 Tax=Pyrococcus yayanosii TaxID=1008460 RepID=UPI00064FC657|nr:4Fe-4S dicluster domain-containing protein [Pyrococcus yayanosii]
MLREDRCIGCGVCSKACPHGAIIVRENQVRILEFHPELCRDCGFECNASCPTGAIEEKPSSRVLKFEYAICAMCGQRLPLTREEAEHLAQVLMKSGGRPEFAYLCDECKIKLQSRASKAYYGYMV